MGSVEFPVYVVCKDSKDIIAFPSYELIKGHLEAIDVENSEYDAFDAAAFALRLGVGGPKASWLVIERTPKQLSATDFAELKAKAETNQLPEPLLRTLGRTLGSVRS